MVEIDTSITARFERFADDATHSERVIVTVADGTDHGELTDAGLRIDQTMLNGRLLIGSIDAGALAALGGLDETVLRIESDGEMHAIESDAEGESEAESESDVERESEVDAGGESESEAGIGTDETGS